MTQEFQTFLEENARSLEKKRKRLSASQGLYNYIVKPLQFITSMVFFFFLITGLIFPINWLGTIISFVVALILSNIRQPKYIYREYIKSELLPKIFEYVNLNYSYYGYGYNAEILKSSGIFNSSFFSKSYRITGEDFVSGSIDGVDLVFNEISFYKEQVNVLKTSGGCLLSIILFPIAVLKGVEGIPFFGLIKDEVKYYKGMFMSADFHKNFHGEVMMIPNNLKSLTDRLSDLIFGKNYTKINLENAVIKDNYTVYGTNVQETFYILSPKIIDAIHEIFLREKVTPVISFRGGKMFMTLPWNRDYFSTDLRVKVRGVEYFTQYIKEIESFEKMMRHFNLNTRIWTKE